MGFKKYKWHKVAGDTGALSWTAGDISEVMVDGKKICIGRSGEELFGFSAVCPHAGAPMVDAYVSGICQVVCPVHSLKFNMKNGRDVNGEGYALKTYPVEVRPDGIFVGMEEGGLFKWF